LCAAPALESYDLAGEWKKMTGLPFVFAVWAVHRSCPHVEEITHLLQEAKDRGCQFRHRLAGLCSGRLGLPEDRCYDYLAHRLRYDVGAREVEGMKLFRELATAFLPPAVGREIRMVSGLPKREDTPIMELS
jgi:predicted solute-binding protein